MISNQQNNNSSLLLNQILVETLLLCPKVDQMQLHTKLTKVLSLYDIKLKQHTNTESDIKEKAQLFLSAKKLEGLSLNSLKSYQLELDIFSRHVTKTVDGVTTSDIRLFLNEFPHLKMSSIAKKLSVLKSFFSWLADEEIIQKDPTRRIKSPKKEKRLPNALTIEELEMLREACTTYRERSLVEVLYATGGRLSEVQALNRNDIDWQNKSAKIIGKGNKERDVYFSFKALYHLKKYLKSRDDLVPALFITERKPYRRLSNRSIQRAIDNIAERSEINKKISPHTFRHTLSTLMLENGADITAIQKILGHSDLNTTQIYAQISDTRKQEQYNRHMVQ